MASIKAFLSSRRMVARRASHVKGLRPGNSGEMGAGYGVALPALVLASLMAFRMSLSGFLPFHSKL